MPRKPNRCLLIGDKYLRLILEGKKTWEIHTQNFRNIGERVALGNTSTGNIEGYATITNSVRMTVQDLKNHADKHRASDFIEMKAANGKNTLFAWFLFNVEKEPNPEPYSRYYERSYGNPLVKLRALPR